MSTSASKSKSSTKKTAQSKTSGKNDGGNSVAILGGGLAGLSAAMRLSMAGFDVTLYELRDTLGGNASSSRASDGIEHDVYPHMFCDWYVNFWDLFENDLGLNRQENFDPRPGVKMLRKGETDYVELLNATSIESVLFNLKSGAMSPAETFLLGFSEIDLVASPFDRSTLNQLDKLDVNGFIYSRGYATEDVARMENYILTLIWSIQSERTAAATYQNFVKHCLNFPDDSPFSWLLKGSLQDKLIAPIEAKLKQLGVTIHTETEVCSLRLVDDRPVVRVRGANSKSSPTAKTFDYAVCALPSHALSELVMGSSNRLKGEKVIEREPSLSELRRLSSVPIPVVDLYLKRKIDGFPKEHIGLAGSRYGLTVLDISQLWEDQDFDGKTAFVVAASDALSIPSDDAEEQGALIIQEFASFYPWFNAGSGWGDPDSDIDWSKTKVRANVDYPLLLNEVGSWGWRPTASYPDTLPRLFFAGDLCKTDVDMATVESAVQSGFLAARALQAQDATLNGAMRGRPIVEIPHTTYSTSTFRAAKLLLLPFAYGALAWSGYEKWKDGKLKEEADEDNGDHYPLSEYLLLVPMQFSIDWCKAAYWFLRSLAENGDDPLGVDSMRLQLPAPTETGIEIPTLAQSLDEGSSDDHVIDLAAATVMVAGECLNFATSRLGPSEGKSDDALASGLSAIGTLIGRATKLGASVLAEVHDAGAAAGARRRSRPWRVKQ